MQTSKNLVNLVSQEYESKNLYFKVLFELIIIFLEINFDV